MKPLLSFLCLALSAVSAFAARFEGPEGKPYVYKTSAGVERKIRAGPATRTGPR
jgi:hypothetical protein